MDLRAGITASHQRPPTRRDSIPPTGVNQATLDGIAPGGAQSRVLGQLAFNGRSATRLQLISTLPYPSVPTPDAHAGAAVASPIPPVGVSPTSGFLFSATSQSGGTLRSELVVDDSTHEILQGHTLSLDSDGVIVGPHQQLDHLRWPHWQFHNRRPGPCPPTITADAVLFSKTYAGVAPTR